MRLMSPLLLALLLPVAGCSGGAGRGPRQVEVSVSPLQSQRFEQVGDYIATLEARDSVKLAAVVNGRITDLQVQEGQQVKQGQVVLQLATSERQADVAKARAELERSRRSYERYSYLSTQGAATAEELDSFQAEFLDSKANLDAQLSRLNDKTVRAPISGQVGDVKVKAGDVVQQGDAFTTIVRNELLYTQISIPVTRAAQVRLGLPVWLLDPVSDAELARSELSFVDPDVNPSTQALLAKAEFPNPEGRLRSGMRVRTQVGFGSQKHVAVPFAAVSRSAGQSFVYVLGTGAELSAERRAKLDGIAEDTVVAIKRPVLLGPLQNSCYPVLKGLEAGEQLITTNLLSLRQGTAVKRKASAQSAPACGQGR